MVSVLDSGAEGHGFKSQPRNSLRQTVHIHRSESSEIGSSRVARVTAGLAESKGSLPSGL